MEELILVQKSGRLANGFQKDHGIIIHGLLINHSIKGIRNNTALCGAFPGRRSAGWVQPYQKENKSITCEKCKKKINKTTTNKQAV